MFNKNDDLPLFLHHGDMNTTYIINNNIIGIENSGGLEDNIPFGSYNCLLTMFNSSVLEQTLPDKLTPFFADQSILKVNSPLGVLISTFGPWAGTNVLDIKLAIDKDKEKPIVVQYLVYYIRTEFIKYPYEVALTPEEAFYIFSNLTVLGIFAHIPILKPEELNSLKKVVYHKYELKEFATGWERKLGQSGTTKVFEYPLAYLNYIKEQLLKNELDLYKLLRLGGITTLYLLAEFPPVKEFIIEITTQLDNPNLTLNQKIMFYTLLNEFKDYAREKYLSTDKDSIKYQLCRFFNSNKDKKHFCPYSNCIKNKSFVKIKKEVSKAFPTRGKPMATKTNRLLSFPSYNTENLNDEI